MCYSIQVTEAVIETISNILDGDVQQSDNSAKASSTILKSIDKQIERTLAEKGMFKSVQPNIAVEGVTVNKTKAGVGFKIIRTDSDISNTEITDGPYGSVNGDRDNSIRLPKSALENGKDKGA